MLLLGLVSAATFILARPIADPLAQHLVNRIATRLKDLEEANISLWPVGVSVVVIALALIYAAGARRWLGFFGLRTFWAHPPIWLAALVCVAILGFWDPTLLKAPYSDPAQLPLVHLWYLIPTFILIAIVVPLFTDTLARRRGYRKANASSQKRPTQRINSDLLATDFDALTEWLNNDHAIDHPALDAFGHSLIADRIANRIDPDSIAPPTIALLGEQGTGKTSIRKLASRAILSRPRKKIDVAVVDIFAWQFDTPNALIRDILRSLVNELSKHTNVLHLRGISSTYLDLLRDGGGRWGFLAHLLKGASSPEETLERIQQTARAIELHIVVWIEDLERFGGRPGDDADHRLRIIDSLHHQLDRCDNISLVLTDANLQSRSVAYKLARYVEYPPESTLWQVWQILGHFRRVCLSDRFMDEKFDPASARTRENLEPPDAEADLRILQFSADRHYMSPKVSLAVILLNPRSLKVALRLTLSRWSVLAGEIDYDDILVMSAIEASYPEVFDVVRRNIGAFRSGFKMEKSLTEQPPKHPTRKELDEALIRIDNPNSREAIEPLLKFVFPNFEDSGDISVRLRKPQSLSRSSHTDYFQRFLQAKSIPTSTSDQVSIKAIQDWKLDQNSNVGNQLVNWFSEGHRTEQLENFGQLLKRSELVLLLEQVSRATIQRRVPEWSSWHHHHDGIESIWRLMQDRAPKPESLFRALRPLLRDVVPNNLPLTHELLYFFARQHSSANVNVLIDESQSGELVLRVRRLLTSSLIRGGPERLVRAFMGGHSWSLYWVVWCVGVLPDDERPLPPFSNWGRLATALLIAAEESPEIVLPQIAPLISSSDRVHHRPAPYDDEPENDDGIDEVARFDEERARALFDFERLMVLFARHPWPKQTDDAGSGRYEAVRDAALEWAQAHAMNTEEDVV